MAHACAMSIKFHESAHLLNRPSAFSTLINELEFKIFLLDEANLNVKCCEMNRAATFTHVNGTILYFCNKRLQN